VHNRIVVNPEVMTTNLEGVFAGGDVVTGPDSAIAAIAAGRKAAFSIDKYLKGEAIEKLPELYNHEKGKLKDIDSEEFLQYEKIPKEKMPMLTREERFGNFEEVELGFNEEKALREANRCLSCGCKDVNECKLREYTTKYNISQDRLKGEMKLHPIDESHEYISHDPNKCIMCGLCVRICNEVIGARVLGFNLRGYSTTITPSFDMPFGEDTRCENCGQCISVCPVGALTEKPKLIKPGPFDEVLISTTCFGCGTGCSTVQHVVGNSVIRTTAKVGVGINSGNLCEKGRFKNNSNIVEKFSRLKQPYIRENDVLVPVSFKVAFDFIRKNLKELQLANGNDSIGIVVSPSMTNEEMEAARKLAVECLKTEALGSEKISSASIGLKKSLSKAYTSANYSNIMEADYILCIGFDIKETNPVAGLLVKQAAEHGAKLTVLSYCETKLAKYATRNLSCNNDGIINLLSQADSILYEEYSKAKNPLIIIGDATADKVAEAVGNFALYFSNNAENILIMHEYCNMRGLIEIGANKKLLYENKLKGAILFDESNYLDYEKVLFKISCSDKIDILKVNTDVVLPLSELTHGPGTYTNSEGRIGEIGFSKSTKLVYSNLEIINALINILNK
jgi:formate dehydrogenase major subunit